MDAELLRKQAESIVRKMTPDSSVLFITGAGLSADSGLPTYRGVGGLYDEKHTPEGIPIEEVLTSRMLRERPEITWKYLVEIGEAVLEHKPNRGHEVIAQFERELDRVWVLTQNIDGYHRRAGTKNLIDIHGDMHTLVCPECGLRYPISAVQLDQLPPSCPSCSAPLRPNVILFGDMLPQLQLTQLVRELEDGFDLVFSIGTSSLFPYISEPVLVGHRLGWYTVEINPEVTDLSNLVDCRMQARAAESLELLWDCWSQLHG